MVDLLQSKMSSLIELLKKHKVKRAYAFGSAVTGNFKPSSDIDLLIAFEDNLDPVEYGQHYFDLADQLEELLQRPVDLLTEAPLKNPYFIKSLNKTKIKIQLYE
jgi:predicted nucleotidyltransferase